jgi:saccharopine dehydrogenase-like NADP-dependent oxidoreductase
MEKKQTAVEWLVEEINKNGEEIHKNGNWIPTHMIEQAKQMEKEQIVDAYTECWMNDGGNGFHKVKEAESYYNETYGGQDEN